MSIQNYQDLTAWPIGVRGMAYGVRDEAPYPFAIRQTPYAARAWQKAMDLGEAVYRATQQWPREELYGMTNQVRRAVMSVPANIAEGKGRYGANEFLHHLSIAMGSLHETETFLHMARRLGYLDEPTCTQLLAQCTAVGQLIGGLMRSLRSTSSVRHTPSA